LLGGLFANTIGGTLPSAGNVISGNGGDGILIQVDLRFTGVPTNNLIQGNLIGTDKTGTVALGNDDGIAIQGGNHTTIGGTAAGAGNTITFSHEFGVAVYSGTGNSILGNSIFSNADLGIALNSATNANNNQAAPVLTGVSSSGSGTTISGTLAGYPSSAFRVELFANPSAAPGQGQTFLGFAQVTTDAQGNFTASLPASLRPGTYLSATATDAAGNTSEFAANLAIKGALTVATSSSLMLVGNNPPPLTGFVNGIPFTSPLQYTTPFGDVVTITLSTTATSASPVGQYPITATLSGANAGNYVLLPTDGTMYVVSLGTDPSSTTGAQAVTFWDNRGNARLITAADLASLDVLNLVNQGGAAFDPQSVAQLQAWLSISPNATTAYQLAVQLAVIDLNLLTGHVQSTDLVYAGALLPFASAYGTAGLTSGGFIDVQNLMSAANSILAQVSPGVPAGDPNAAYEAALASVLQAANANTDFVQQELLWNLVGLYPSLTGQP
jgi:hypothetical protein